MAEGYVLDTHALLFYAADQTRKLGPTARRAFAAFERGDAFLTAHRDLFDRLIVACARRVDLPLLTRDSAITAWAEETGGVEVAW